MTWLYVLIFPALYTVTAVLVIAGALRRRLAEIDRRLGACEGRVAAIEPARVAELDRALTARLTALDEASDPDDGLRRLSALATPPPDPIPACEGPRSLAVHVVQHAAIVSGPRAHTSSPGYSEAEHALRAFGFPAWVSGHYPIGMSTSCHFERYTMRVHVGAHGKSSWCVGVKGPWSSILEIEKREGWINGGQTQVVERATIEMLKLLVDHGFIVDDRWRGWWTR